MIVSESSVSKFPRNVITLAAGKKLYFELAVNLARSFFWWHPQTDIRFYLATDSENLLPADLAGKINIIPMTPGEFGEGFTPKLSLDKLVPEGQSLFIDSDCLIFGDLSPIFEKFSGHPVSVIGGYISKGEWFGDIAAICKKYDVQRLPKFNGGIYYLEKGAVATAVYQTARELEKKYDEIGFVRLRNRPNDEVIMALAMELHEQRPVADDGSFMGDLQACQGPYRLGLLTGERELTNPPPPFPRHNDWFPFQKIRPLVVHFLGYYTHHEPYIREVSLLRKITTEHQHPLPAKISTWFTVTLPMNALAMFKNLFRMPYRAVFGTRKVKISNRI